MAKILSPLSIKDLASLPFRGDYETGHIPPLIVRAPNTPQTETYPFKGSPIRHSDLSKMPLGFCPLTEPGRDARMCLENVNILCLRLS